MPSSSRLRSRLAWMCSATSLMLHVSSDADHSASASKRSRYARSASARKYAAWLRPTIPASPLSSNFSKAYCLTGSNILKRISPPALGGCTTTSDCSTSICSAYAPGARADSPRSGRSQSLSPRKSEMTTARPQRRGGRRRAHCGHEGQRERDLQLHARAARDLDADEALLSGFCIRSAGFAPVAWGGRAIPEVRKWI